MRKYKKHVFGAILMDVLFQTPETCADYESTTTEHRGINIFLAGCKPERFTIPLHDGTEIELKIKRSIPSRRRKTRRAADK